MTIAVQMIGALNEELAITYDNPIYDAYKTFFIFKELCEISMTLGNEYSEKNPGTSYDTIKSILVDFYYNHDCYPTIEDLQYSYNIMNNLYNNCYPPSIVSIYNYSIIENGDKRVSSSAHSVTVLGALNYIVEYKTYPWYNSVIGNKNTQTYYIFVICNGWKNSNVGGFGDNLQLLIFDDKANFVDMCNVSGWIDYYEE